MLTYSLIGRPDGRGHRPRRRACSSWTPGPDQLGQFTFTVRVTDAGGLFAEQSVTLTTLGVVDGKLVYVGTAGRDAMIFEAASGRRGRCLPGRDSVGTFSGVSRIVAHGLGGNDILMAVGAVPVEFHGGAGNDWLTGGVAADMLFGGQGADLILGGAGNDRLSGRRSGPTSSSAAGGTTCSRATRASTLLIDTTGKDQYLGGAGDFLVDDSATINPTVNRPGTNPRAEDLGRGGRTAN